MDELREMIEGYANRLAAALLARDEAAAAVEQLDAQIRAEEWRIAAENTDDIQLEHELGLLELDYDRLRGEIELSYRREMNKATGAAIAAMVRADDRVVAAKRAVLDKRHERDLHARHVGMMRHSVSSPGLERLRNDLETANRAYQAARRHVEVTRAELLFCQILTQLSDSSQILSGSLEIAA